MTHADLLATISAAIANLSPFAADPTDRLVIADMLDEADRHDEAAILRNTSAYFVVRRRTIVSVSLARFLYAGRDAIRVAVTDEQDVPALADDGGPEPYPSVTLTASCGPWELSIQGWKLVRMVAGPQDPWDGDWIGNGWTERVHDSDGQYSGWRGVEYDQEDHAIRVRGGDHISDGEVIECGDLTPQQASLLAERLDEEFGEAYADWSPETPNDDDIAFALSDYLASKPEWKLDKVARNRVVGVDADGYPVKVEVEVFFGSATHLDRPYWGVVGLDGTLFDTYDDAYEAAADLADKMIAAEAEKVADQCLSMHDLVEVDEDYKGEYWRVFGRKRGTYISYHVATHAEAILVLLTWRDADDWDPPVRWANQDYDLAEWNEALDAYTERSEYSTPTIEYHEGGDE